MELTQFDVTVAVALMLGVILMTWMFPALGLTGDEAQEDDIPEFNVSADRFDFSGDFPQYPGNPRSEPLNWAEDGSYDNQLWLEGGTSSGHQLFVINDNTTSSPEIRYELSQWDSGNVVESDNVTFTSENSRDTLSAGDYEVYVELQRLDNVGTQDFEALGQFEVRDDGSNTPWWNPIPDVAGAVVWIGQIIGWLFLSIWEFVLNGAGLLYDVASFALGLLIFMSTNYVDIVTADALHPFASLVLVAPLVIMYLLWLKIVLVLVDILWIG